MPRHLLCPLAALLVGGLALADEVRDRKDADKDAKRIEATVQKANVKDGTVTVELMGKSGKERVRTFKVTRETRLLSPGGKKLTLKNFPVGTKVFLIERDGKVVEMRARESPTDTGKATRKAPPASSPPDR
jgi:hypothetical protein